MNILAGSSFDLIQHLAGNANTAAISDSFKSCRDIDSVAEYVAVVGNDVPNIDANTKLYSILRRCIGIALSHSTLDFYGAPHRVHRACKFNQHAVAGRLNDVSPMFLYLGIAKLMAMRF